MNPTDFCPNCNLNRCLITYHLDDELCEPDEIRQVEHAKKTCQSCQEWFQKMTKTKSLLQLWKAPKLPQCQLDAIKHRIANRKKAYRHK